MVKIVYGPSGSGKSTYVYNQIENDLKNNKKPILIVPDQHILSAESAISDISKKYCSLDVEVLSFRRLANHVFRELGGLSFSDIDNGGRLLIMWRAVNEISPFLTEYNNIDEKNTAFAELMMNTVDDLKQFLVTPAMLNVAAAKVKESHPHLSRKLNDISLIYSTYQSFVSSEYNDPTDEITRLADTLEGTTFFAENTMYFDAFDGFTPQQYAVIHHIINQADCTTFSICYNPEDKTGVFNTTEKTFNIINKFAKKNNIQIENTFLKKNKSFSNKAILYVAENLWKHDVRSEDFCGDSNGVDTVVCHDIFEECEVVVSDILKKVRQGARYKDIVIIARDIKQYEGVIDCELENNGIPFYMSKRTDIISKPIFKLILSAFAIRNKGWKYSDVISYVKTGLTGVSYDECDILENYVSAWNINGSRWYDSYDWNMNPDGFTEVITDEGRNIINQVNEIRRKITNPLIKFFDCIGGTSVTDVTKGLYDFLCEISVREKIELQAAKCRAEENFSEEKELVQLWNILINSLDMLVEIMGDCIVDGEKYVTLLSILLSKTDIGTIPANIDNVILGSASNLRTGDVPHVYLLGVNEGVFPKSTTEDSIFSDNEKIILKGIDVELSPISEEETSDELYWFYRAISRARESLMLVYSESDLKGSANKISTCASRVNFLLNNKDILRYDHIPPMQKLQGKCMAIKMLSLYNDREIGVALKNYFENDEELRNIISSFESPLVAGNERIDDSLACEIYKGNISTSQSRVDSFVKCSFEYHCKHILKLREKKTAVFRSNDIGTFVHTVLERFMSRIANEDGINTEISQDEIECVLDEIISEYMKVACSGLPEKSPRLLKLFMRLKKTTLLLVNNILSEFRQSDFIPSFFELPISKDSEEGIEPYEIPLEDGTKLYMRGFVDRVDTFKKGKDVYIRIVDYKTGNKTFSPDDLAKGLNLQMMLYLFAAWNSKSSLFREKIKCDGEILPAGILYFSAKAPEVSIENDGDIGRVYGIADKSIERKGILLNDMDVLRAMDKQLDGSYIPVKLYKNGNLSNTQYLQTLEEFGKTSEMIDGILKNIAKDMKSGKINASPMEMKNKNESPCLYCKMKPICRRIERGDENE